MHRFNDNKNTVGFDINSRLGTLTDENYDVIFEFAIDVMIDNEIMLGVIGTNDRMRYSEVNQISNKEIRSELVRAFEQVAAEEEAIRVRLFEPCPDEKYDSRI